MPTICQASLRAMYGKPQIANKLRLPGQILQLQSTVCIVKLYKTLTTKINREVYDSLRWRDSWFAAPMIVTESGEHIDVHDCVHNCTSEVPDTYEQHSQLTMWYMPCMLNLTAGFKV